PDVADLDAATHEFGVRGLDVGDDQSASGRGGRSRRESQTERKRCPGAGWGKLDDAEPAHRGDVVVEPPTQMVVELLGPTDVGHRNDVDLEVHLDGPAHGYLPGECPQGAGDC